MSSQGPWRRMEDGTIWTDENLDGVPSGTLVCFLPPVNGGFNEADARLIASSPELLQALVMWHRCTDPGKPGEPRRTADSTCECCKLIARVIG